MSGGFECNEYCFYSLRTGVWWRKLLEDADFMDCDWFFSLCRSFGYQLSTMDEICPLFLLFGYHWTIVGFWRTNDLWSEKMDRLWAFQGTALGDCKMVDNDFWS